MLKEYRPSPAKRKAAIRYLNEEREALQLLGNSERRIALMSLFSEMFEGFLEPENFKNCMALVIISFVPENISLHKLLTQSETQKIYEEELIILKRIATDRKVPSYLKRLLASNFLENLNGPSSSNIPAFDCRNKTHIKTKEMIASEVIQIRDANYGEKDPFYDFQKPIPFKKIELIMSSPFYRIALKKLLLWGANSSLHYTDLQKKKLNSQLWEPRKGDAYPYSYDKRIRLAAIMESFLILAKFYDLPRIMAQFDPPKKTLPYLNTAIIKTIVEASDDFPETEQKIRDELRELFDINDPLWHNKISAISSTWDS